MSTRRAVIGGVLMLLATPLAAEAQQTAKVSQIGYLSLASADSDKSAVAAFRRELRELGYLEGRSIIIERYAQGRSERLPHLAAELVRRKIDVLVAVGDAAAAAAKEATRTIPIVMSGADPVGLGLVTSLARPGGNLTGLTDAHSDLVAKRLELLREVVPSASRVAVFFDPASPIAAPQLKAAHAAATTLGMIIVPVDVKGSAARDFDSAAATIRKERPEGLLVVAEPTVRAHRERLADFAVKIRLPTIGTFPAWAEDGFLMSYGAERQHMWRRRAAYVDKILRGAAPGDLPIEQPTKFELAINMKTARALGLSIPPSMLLRADHVIE